MIARKRSFQLIFVILSILLIEFGLRLLHYLSPLPIFYEDANPYRGKPYSDNYGYKLNSEGYKDIDFKLKKSANTCRIIGIGDSFVFGVAPYPHNFLTILEDSLNGHPIKPFQKVEVINMGIPSTSPPDYLALLMKEGMALNPDIVLLSIFVGNDFNESYTRRSARSWKTKLFYKSYSLVTLHYLYKIFVNLDSNKIRSLSYGNNKTYCDTCAFMTPTKYIELGTSKSFLFDKNDPLFQQSYDDLVYYVDQIIAECNKRNMKLIIALLPDEIQVNRGFQHLVKKQKGIAESTWDNTRPNRELSSYLLSKNIVTIDLLDTFVKSTSDSTSFYIPRDTHWNIKGNQLAAKSLFEKMKRIDLSVK